MWYQKPMIAEGVKIYNPAFDVTDNDLVTGFVTEYGVVKAPFEQGLKEVVEKAKKGHK